MDTINLSKYKVEHEIKLPTKNSDYDYDSSNPNRRFVSTFLHNLVFYDNITNAEIVKLRFSSETCAKIVSALYSISAPESRQLMLSIKNVYVDDSAYPAIMAVYRVHNNDMTSDIQISLLRNNIEHEHCYILLNNYDVELMIRLFENDVEQVYNQYG